MTDDHPGGVLVDYPSFSFDGKSVAYGLGRYLCDIYLSAPTGFDFPESPRNNGRGTSAAGQNARIGAL